MYREFQEKPNTPDLNKCNNQPSSREYSPRSYCECCLQENDENKILVSVSPKFLELPKSYHQTPTMIIKNRNPFPVFFKTCSTNMNAFVPYPTTGRIAPYNKVTINISFLSSATPLRLHEDVIILTSLQPFTKEDQDACRYCFESHWTKSQKYQDPNLYESSGRKRQDDEKFHVDLESKIKIVCKACNQGIETKGMKLEDSHDGRRYFKCTGIIEEHKCLFRKHLDETETDLKTVYQKAVEEPKKRYRTTKVIMLNKKPVDGGKDESSSEYTSEKSIFVPRYQREKETERRSEYLKKDFERARQRDDYKKDTRYEEQKDLKHEELYSRPCCQNRKSTDFEQRKPHICAKILRYDLRTRNADEENAVFGSAKKQQIVFISERDTKKYQYVPNDQSTSSSSEKSVIIAQRSCRRQPASKKIMVSLDQKCSKILYISKTTLFVIVLIFIFVLGNIYCCYLKKN